MTTAAPVTLKRVLTLRNLVMFGLAYLAPTVVFDYYGIVTGLTGGMMALAYVVTLVAISFTAYSYALMVKAFPVAGSAYTYVRRAVHPYLGFLTGWVMLLDYLLLPMVCYLLVGIFMNEFVPGVPVWVWVLLAAAVGAFTNILGVKVAGWVNTVVVTAQIVFAVAFVGIVVNYVGDGGGSGTLFDGSALFRADTFETPSLLWAASILAASFLGFDAVSTMAEETVEPEKTVPRAVMIVPLAAGVFFGVVSYFTQIAWPNAYSEIEDQDAGIFELLPRLGGHWLSTTFLVIDNLSSMICAIAGIAAAARVLYGMGRDGALPQRFFGTLSPRFQTPVNNILLMTVIALSAVLYSDNLLGAASLVAFGALTGFVLVNYSVISHYYLRQRRRQGADVVKYLVLPVIGMIVCAVLWYHVDKSAMVLGGIWLALGIVYLAISTKGFRVQPAEIALDETESEAATR